ncbi:hypothetical protein JHK87_022252 [Glycine soja]|nr:hypothetical protein JHK87_022252 [Glycine soja]
MYLIVIVFSYPPIDPINFDLIIVGTVLSESIIAVAAFVVGKTILHLDPNSFYDNHFASLSFHDLTSYLTSPHSFPFATITVASSNSNDIVVVDLVHQPICTDVETATYDESRKFNIDLGGPMPLFCTDKTIDLLMKLGATQYLEFKGINESFVYEANTGLVNVLDSRGAIFRN